MPCLPSKRFDGLYRLYRSLRDRYLSTVVGGQCVANKHVKSPLLILLDVFVWIVLPNVIRSWGYTLCPILAIVHRYIIRALSVFPYASENYRHRDLCLFSQTQRYQTAAVFWACLRHRAVMEGASLFLLTESHALLLQDGSKPSTSLRQKMAAFLYPNISQFHHSR